MKVLTETIILVLLITSSNSLLKKSKKMKKTKKDTSTTPSHSLYTAINIKCSQTICPSPNFCNDSGDTCYCAKGYVNDPRNSNPSVYCSYKQHKQLTSFLWELLTNFGIGHLIIGNVWKGLFKMLFSIVFFTLCGLIIAKILTIEKSKDILGIVVTLSIYVSFIILFIWWMVDIVLFARNKYKDHNKVPLKHW